MPYDGKSIPEYIARCEDAVGERVRLIYNGKDRGEFIVVGVQFVPEIDATCGIFACSISFSLTEGTIRYRERVKDASDAERNERRANTYTDGGMIWQTIA